MRLFRCFDSIFGTFCWGPTKSLKLVHYGAFNSFGRNNFIVQGISLTNFYPASFQCSHIIRIYLFFCFMHFPLFTADPTVNLAVFKERGHILLDTFRKIHPSKATMRKFSSCLLVLIASFSASHQVSSMSHLGQNCVNGDFLSQAPSDEVSYSTKFYSILLQSSILLWLIFKNI